MFRRARERGPALLVPLAWLFVIAAHLEVVTEHTLFVAHVVMAVLLVVFAASGRADMRHGTLQVWWYIVVVGVVLTVVGAVGFLVESWGWVLQAVALLGWMLLPAVGFVETGRRVIEGIWTYVGGATGCLLGALLYVGGLLAALQSLQILGLVLVATGQTAGILDAVVRY